MINFLNKIKEILYKLYQLILSILKEDKNNEVIYEKKQYLTNNERIFYKKLVELEKVGDYKVIPQVNLATIINKKSIYKYQSELFRNIDFVIFDKNLSTTLILIELNDISHKSRTRKMRDIKVKNICNSAGLKLITFYTKYDNKKEYIINRIIKEIQSNETITK